MPDITVERVITRFANHLNDQDLPIIFITLDGDVPFGMCRLRENDAIRPDVTPWLALLVVDLKYQQQGYDHQTYRLGSDMLIHIPTAADYALKVPKEQELLPQLAKYLSINIPAQINFLI